MITSRKKAILWTILGVSLAGIAVAAAAQGIGTPQAATARTDDQNWLAVAPGLIEPKSGQIKILSAAIGPISKILVRANDKVLAGQLLVSLDDQDARAQVESSRDQVQMHKRQRNDQAAGKAADRRKAEDAVADAETAVITARDTFDNAAIAIYDGHGSPADLTKARTDLTSAEDSLSQKRAALHKLEGQSGTPLPTENEGSLNVARSNLWSAEVGLEKLKIRAPIAGTALQVNAKLGELASPSSPDPLVVLGDLSALRVRAELDERDIAEVKIGQPVVVRADAFPGRDFHGKVASIAELVWLETFRAHAGEGAAPMFGGARGEKLRVWTELGGIVAPAVLRFVPFGGRAKTVIASALALAGGYVLREVLIEAGKDSADDPRAASRQPE